MFVVAILVNVGMWFERFVIIVTSLRRDFLPSSWGYYTPTLVDVLTLRRQLRPVLHAVPAVLPLPADGRHGRGQERDARPRSTASTGHGDYHGDVVRAGKPAWRCPMSRLEDEPAGRRLLRLPGGRVRRRGAAARGRREGARRRLHPLGRAHAVPGPRPRRGDGHPRRRSCPGWCSGGGLTGAGLRHPAAVVDQRHRLPVHDSAASRSSACPPTSRSPSRLTVLFAAITALRRHAGPQPAAAALAPAARQPHASSAPPTTASSSASRRATRSSIRGDPGAARVARRLASRWRRCRP